LIPIPNPIPTLDFQLVLKTLIAEFSRLKSRCAAIGVADKAYRKLNREADSSVHFISCGRDRQEMKAQLQNRS
jgi:hypothetical protein